MRILVVNDDGIDSKGILRLAQLASRYGETWVVAPDHQCSGMSQRITIQQKMTVTKCDFPVPKVHRAFTCSGTPADCSDVGVQYLMDEKPDVIFSGINSGYNAGYDIAYSGTIGAAMEGLMLGIPAIAFSHENDRSFEVTDHYIKEVADRIMSEKLPRDRIWNINFPECTLKECRGVRWDVRPAGAGFYETFFEEVEKNETSCTLINADVCTKAERFPEGTDLEALMGGYVSAGTVLCNTMPEAR